MAENQNIMAPGDAGDSGAEGSQPQGAGSSFSEGGGEGHQSPGLQGIGIGKKAPFAREGKAPAPAKPGAPPPAPAEGGEEQRYPVTVNGKEEMLTLSELRENARLGKAAFKKMQEAAEVRKSAEGLLGKFKDRGKLFEALQEAGHSEEDIRSTFEDWYHKRVVEPSMMTPEQRELAQMREKLQRYESEKEQEALRTEQQKTTQAQKYFADKFQQDIIKSIDAGGLPKDPKTVSRIAYYMSENIKNKLGLPMEAIVERVKADYREELQAVVGGFEPEQFVRFMGEDTAKKLASYYAAELRKRKGLQSAQPLDRPEEAPERPTRRVPEDRRHTPAYSKAWVPVVD
jgi:hypothetical protein